jgi:hypothetical protein
MTDQDYRRSREMNRGHDDSRATGAAPSIMGGRKHSQKVELSFERIFKDRKSEAGYPEMKDV